MKNITIDGESLTIQTIVDVARQDAIVELSEKAVRNVTQAHEALQILAKKDSPIYGVTTGFGALGNVSIAPDDISQLQLNLIRSHSSGVGSPLPREVVRALMLLRANTLAKGFSGVRLHILETLVQMLNKRVHPIVPEKGSVGASGDLTPLSHMVLVMIGEGKAEYNHEVMDGKEAMDRAAINLVTLGLKEGVALNNGTQMMTAIGALNIYDAENLVQTAEVAAALSLEALQGIIDAFDPKIQSVRAHKGQMETAQNIRTFLSKSRLVKTSNESVKDHKYPQDPYSLRCIPQVLGCVRDAIGHVKRIIQTEINSATDNPLVFSQEEQCLSGGNFHGQPIAIAMDYLSIALTIIGSFAERRIARIMDHNLSQGLPPFLIPQKAKRGLQSGFMTLQYTAAALASENKSLAHPASVDSIPTSANFEDFVSMGPIAARKAQEILRNAQIIVAIEILCAAQAIEFRDSEKLGNITSRAYQLVRERVAPLEDDRVLFDDIRSVVELVRRNQFSTL